jgi:hypothetical protein
MNSFVRVRVLERATGIVGGVDLLAAMLEVSAEQITQWLRSDTPIPSEVYFRTLELVNEEQPKSRRPKGR